MKSCIFIALTATCICLSAGNAGAVTLVSSEGFEAPFSVGALGGQQQWVDLGTGASSAVVQNTMSKSGSQALQVYRASLSDRFWAKRITTMPSGRYVSIDWDMFIYPTGAETGLGPFFGVNVFDDTNGLVTLGALGVDATTGDILIQEGGSGELIEAPAMAPDGEWGHYRIELDFSTDTYSTYLNGVFIVSTGFVDAHLGIDRLTDADIVGFAAGGDSASQSQVGTAYFDNFIVRAGLRGDYNNNGVVDAADYTVWRDQLGQTTFGLAADGNADGIVDGDDYLLWVNTFGDTNAIPSAAHAVPEPTAVFLAASLGLLSAVCRRRQ